MSETTSGEGEILRTKYSSVVRVVLDESNDAFIWADPRPLAMQQIRRTRTFNVGQAS